MRYSPLHCWDCGVRVIQGVDGIYTLQPNFRQVRFSLEDGSYCESPFCADCASKSWTQDRLQSFEAAVNLVDSRHQITVRAVEGTTLPRVNVLEPIQLSTLNVTPLPAPLGG